MDRCRINKCTKFGAKMFPRYCAVTSFVPDHFTAHCRYRGVSHGCSLSPLAFIIYDDAMVKRATENDERGIKVAGKVISLIR